MAFSTVFKRYELKYLITSRQRDLILRETASYLEGDSYGKTNIRNLYFDTPDFRLIRHSIAKPSYKEKLRIRAYGKKGPDETVFVELKKKYNHLVFKRRIALPQKQALQWITNGSPPPVDTQISREIDYFLSFYGCLESSVFLSYDREAYYCRDDKDLRVTFDTDIRFCQGEKSLEGSPSTKALLPEDSVLMEIKCTGAIPLWLTDILSRERIYKTSFSKYGTVYVNHIFPHIGKGE